MTEPLEMRDAINAAVEEHEEPSAGATEPPAGTTEPPAGTTEPPAGTTGTTEPPAGAAGEAEPPAVDPDLARQHRVDRAPASWRKESKDTWNQLPLSARQEVYRRETEINRTLNDTAQARQFTEQFNQVVSPYLARIRSAGTGPMEAVEALMKADYTLATAPRGKRAEFMASLITNYDIDIDALSEALAGKPQQQSQQNAAPDIERMIEQRVQQALAPLYQERQQAALQSQQQVFQTVESMSLNPNYQYFDELREDMADLIELSARRGIDITLEQAYDKAMTMTGKSGQLASMSAMQAQHAQATKAKAASLSISGSPAGGGAQVVTSDGSLRGDLEAAVANMNRI